MLKSDANSYFGSACGTADPKDNPAPACGSACGAKDPKEENPAPACGSGDPAPACGSKDPEEK